MPADSFTAFTNEELAEKAPCVPKSTGAAPADGLPAPRELQGFMA
jgi:hypothetical protein